MNVMQQEIDELSTDDESDDKYISTNSLKEIWRGNYVHPEINARYARLKIRDRIRQTQSEWKGEELSSKSMGKGSNKLFKAVINEINITFPI